MPENSRSAAAANVIEIKNLVKNFGRGAGRTVALNGFDMSVAKGEIHGFLGPNGAGKSTTIRIVLGLLKKSSGSVKLFGADPWKFAKNLHEKLAYVPGDVNFWPNLTGGEIIDLLAELRKNPHENSANSRQNSRKIYENRREDLLKKFELDPTKKFATYSKGNRQKVALVAALASDVPLYILDEPTSGLDPLMENVFQNEIRELATAGKTILLSSHILSEAESLCDRATIIRAGRTVGVYSLKELRERHEDLAKIFLSKYEDKNE